MFEQTSRLAEKLATGVSRRGFLGSVGRWAGATALAMAGVLTTAGSARANNCPPGTRKANCNRFNRAPICCPPGMHCICPPEFGSVCFCLQDR